MKTSPILPAPQQVIATVVDIKNVAPHHFLISLRAPHITAHAEAGQFIHVLPRDSALPDPFLRRAFSVMSARGDVIEILFRVEGIGTAQIAKKAVGETLDVIGPLGRPFDLSPFHVKHDKETDHSMPILVGGGVGVPPMAMLGERLRNQHHKPLMLMGARSKTELLCLSHFEELDIETRIATDDGSAGIAGRVTDLLVSALESTTGAVVYACGPLAMLRAVAGIAERFGVACQVSMEENMPCGIGVCNGCVVAMKNPTAVGKPMIGADYGRYRRICVEGPAVWAHDIDWETG